MNSYVSELSERNFSRGRVVYSIVTLFAIKFLVAISPVEADESSDKDIQSVLDNSIAVLSFENLSPNPDDAYFALGVHGEILDYLTKIRDVSPIFRSAIYFLSKADIM